MDKDYPRFKLFKIWEALIWFQEVGYGSVLVTTIKTDNSYDSDLVSLESGRERWYNLIDNGYSRIDTIEDEELH